MADRQHDDHPALTSLLEQQAAHYFRLGGSYVDNPQQTRDRLEVCSTCPEQSTFDLPGVPPNVTKCDACGCMLRVKARLHSYFSAYKLRTVKAACPLGKWAPVDANYSQR
jgi:hypothetical protein